MGASLRTFEYFDARDREKAAQSVIATTHPPLGLAVRLPTGPQKSYKPSELDFSFAENATRYRGQVAASINNILKNNRSCVDIDPDTLVSSSERPSTNPSLQVVCKDAAGRQFPVQFHAKDAASGVRVERGTDAIAEDDAGRICQKAIAMKLPARPMPVLGEAYFRSTPSGKASVTGQVDAGDRQYRAICRFVGRAIVYVSVE